MMRKRPLKKAVCAYPVVRVEWTDAWSEDGWKDIKTLPANALDARVNTIGYLVNEDGEFYYVANSVSALQVACTMVVPKSMVTSFSVLEI